MFFFWFCPHFTLFSFFCRFFSLFDNNQSNTNLFSAHASYSELILSSCEFHPSLLQSVFLYLLHTACVCSFFLSSSLSLFQEYLRAPVTSTSAGFRSTCSAATWSSAPGRTAAGLWTCRWSRPTSPDTSPTESGTSWVRARHERSWENILIEIFLTDVAIWFEIWFLKVKRQCRRTCDGALGSHQAILQ